MLKRQAVNIIENFFFSQNSDQESVTLQPELQFSVSNIDVQFCETLNLIGASGSIGAFEASLKSTCEYSVMF